jgi:4-amino-4-deoxychorismate lyase
MARSRLALWGLSDELNPASAIAPVLEKNPIGLYKVRVLYDQYIRKVEAVPYVRRAFASVALLDGGSMVYAHKSVKRTELDALESFAKESGADTALIAVNGRITDFCHANAAFFDGRDWYTPSSPLLPGTRRAELLEAGRLIEAEIRPEQLERYRMVSPINAMLDLNEISLPVERILRS